MGWWSDVLADGVGRADGIEIVSCFTRSDKTGDQTRFQTLVIHPAFKTSVIGHLIGHLVGTWLGLW